MNKEQKLKLSDDDIVFVNELLKEKNHVPYAVALHAIEINRLDILKYIIEKYRSSKYNYEALLNLAIQKGNLDIVKYLISSFIKNPIYTRFYILAIINGHMDLVKYFESQALRLRQELNETLGLTEAIKNNHMDIASYLSGKKGTWKKLNPEYAEKLLKYESNELKNILTTAYLGMSMHEKQNEDLYHRMAKNIKQKTVYRGVYEDLCRTIKGNIPPLKLIALAKILQIDYDENTTYAELCGKVNLKIISLL